MATKNLRSDAAYRRVLKYARIHNILYVRTELLGAGRDFVVTISSPVDFEPVAEISIRDIISKRKPLKGIKAVPQDAAWIREAVRLMRDAERGGYLMPEFRAELRAHIGKAETGPND